MSCSRSLLLVTNSFLSIVGAGVVGVGVYLTVVEPASRAFLQVLPTAVIQGAMGLGAFILFVAGLGFLATCSRNRFFMYLYIFLTIVTFILTAILVPYILLYVNGIGTIDGLDDAFNTAALAVQAEFIPYAVAQPADWLQLQDSISCCGLSLSALYANGGQDNLAVLTGTACEAGRDAINNILQQVPPEGDGLDGAPDQAVQLQIADPIINPDQNFFCLDLIASNLFDQSIFIGIGGAVMAILQLLNIRAAFVVLYRVGRSQGGFVLDDFAQPPPMMDKTPPPPPPGMMGRVSVAMNRMTRNDFFRPPPPPMAGGPNFMNDARKVGSRMSSQFRGMGQGAAQLGNRVSMAMRGGKNGNMMTPNNRGPPPGQGFSPNPYGNGQPQSFGMEYQQQRYGKEKYGAAPGRW